jgi:iron complex transport system ATP-binding protein
VPLALQADRLVVMQAGCIRAEGRVDDPQVHEVLAAVFEHAIRIERLDNRLMALPNLD